MTHTYTREPEDAFDYICRHTLLRPRDLMTIGERLSALRPEERRDEYRLKEGVNHAATEIAYEYLAEIAPHLGDLEIDRLLRRLPGHILTRNEVETLFDDHTAATGSGDDKHVFCALYRAGLLGYVHHDRIRGESVQRFLRPGEATLDPDGTLPPATHYLVHPVLSDVIGRMNPGYLQRIDRRNIVGYGRPWRDTESSEPTVRVEMRCVLKADIHGFGGLMRSGTDGPVRKALEDAVKKWSQGAGITETRGGDSFVVIHEDAGGAGPGRAPDHGRCLPGAGATPAAHGLASRRGADARARRGPDAGAFRGRRHPVRDARRAARGARTDLGDGRFRQQLVLRPSLWRTTPIPGPGGAERFNVKKDSGTEPDLWVRLYRLEL